MIHWQVHHQLPKASIMYQRKEQRRKQAIDTYLAGDKVEDICRQLACAKSWLYKWRDRYDAQHPAWTQEWSTQPKRPNTSHGPSYPWMKRYATMA